MRQGQRAVWFNGKAKNKVRSVRGRMTEDIEKEPDDVSREVLTQ